MKIVQINVSDSGSTGGIMKKIQQRGLEEGMEMLCFYGRGGPSSPEKGLIRMEGKLSVYAHGAYARAFDKMGHGSLGPTRRLVARLSEEKPDIVHLHNIHGYYINISTLAVWLKENNIKTVWTLHDCWGFTGGCAYYLDCGCDKWKNACGGCPQLNVYPKRFIDRSQRELAVKKRCFGDLDRLVITTPSHWLADQVAQSFLSEKETVVVSNGVDTDTFRPRGKETDLETRKRLGISPEAKMILGVANVWDERKRLGALLRLGAELKDKGVSLCVVGLSEKQKAELPGDVIGIVRTENKEEMARIYSAADLFVSTSVEESFSLVVAEAMASGTPIVTVDGGGCTELVSEKVGLVVPRDDPEALRAAALAVLGSGKAYGPDCVDRCRENYSIKNMLDGYMEVYRRLYER